MQWCLKIEKIFEMPWPLIYGWVGGVGLSGLVPYIYIEGMDMALREFSSAPQIQHF